MLKRIWRDPVGSAVIATVLTTALLAAVAAVWNDGRLLKDFQHWRTSSVVLEVWQLAAWLGAALLLGAILCRTIVWKVAVAPRNRLIMQLTADLARSKTPAAASENALPTLASEDFAVTLTVQRTQLNRSRIASSVARQKKRPGI